jgi:hypothetical protein
VQPAKPGRPAIASRVLVAPPTPGRRVSTASATAQVLGLSRLQHVLHVLQPVRALFARVSGNAHALGSAAHAAHQAHGAAAVAGMSAGSRFVRGMGGALGLVSAVVSLPLFWLDLKSARTTLADPTVQAREKAWTKLQLALSGTGAATSAAALVTATVGLAVPGAMAIVPTLLGVSGLAGVGSFVVSLLRRRGHAAHAG